MGHNTTPATPSDAVCIEAQYDAERGEVRLLATIGADRHAVTVPAADRRSADHAARQFAGLYSRTAA